MLQAARQFHSLRLGVPILLGDRAKIKEVAQGLEYFARRHPHHQSGRERGFGKFCAAPLPLRRDKGLRNRGAGSDAAAELLRGDDGGDASGGRLVSGASQITGSVLRPLFQIIQAAPDITTVSSCMVMEVEDTRFGEKGVLFMGDCGVIPEPNVEQLADIAVSTARLARQMLGVRPRVALLSFSTKGSATHPSIGKVQAATAQAGKKAAATERGGGFRR